MNNNGSQPLVSIIIPTYKRSERLSRAIKSVLNQTYTNIEVLVVSDNEPDDDFSAAAKVVVDSFGDSRVRLILQHHHINGAAARNAGIKASKGEYIAFLDDDDFWDKDKLEIQVPVLLSLDDSWGGVSCYNRIFKGGKLISMKSKYDSGYLYKSILLRRIEVSTITVLLKKKYLIETGMFDETLRRNQEVQMLTFFTHKYKLLLIEKYLCNVDIDDVQNRPSPEQFKKVKADFFKAVEPILNSLSSYERFSIKLSNRFELGGLCLLSGEYFKGLAYSLPVILSPLACKSAFTRIYRRKRERRIPADMLGKDITYFISQNKL